MATGDAALAAGLDLVSGTAAANTIDTELNKTRDYIGTDRTATRPVNRGGTGATTAAAARTNLGVAATSHTHTRSQITDWPAVTPVTAGGTGGTTKATARSGIGITVSATAPDSPATGDVWIKST